MTSPKCSCSIRSALKILLFLVLISSLACWWYFSALINIINTLQNQTKDIRGVDITRYAFRQENVSTSDENTVKMKNILIWTSGKTVPFVYLGNGQEVFQNSECEFQNCYITTDVKHLSSVAEFDAVLFHGPEFTYTGNRWTGGLPKERSPDQRYIFASIESSHYYPACDETSDGFFNWTWTYRTDGDVKWGYVDIKDLNGTIIGPKENVSWIEDMKDVTEEFKEGLQTKTKAAAWFTSHCYTKSDREHFAERLITSLRKFGLKVDVFGKCGSLECSRDKMADCYDMLKKDYFFYFAFENSLSEDYVTEKFLHAFKNNVVPVVYGGADYSRFAPPGSYLDGYKARSTDALAEDMYDMMNNPELYASYFRWQSYYKYQRDVDTPDTRAECRLCAALNDREKMTTRQVYQQFRKWWNGDVHKRC